MKQPNDNYRVSIIIPTHGRPEFLLRAVESVMQQTYKNIEIIIVDDNEDPIAHDQTFSILKKIKSSETHASIKYFFDGKNRGGSLARNKGIEISTGDYITFLDDDDIYLPEKIKSQVEHLIENNLDVSVCDMYFKRNGKFLNVGNCYAQVDNFNSFLLSGISYTPMIMSSKQAMIDINGFTDTPRFQDHVLMLKLFESGKKIGHLKEKLFIHNDHNLSRVTFSKKSEEAYRIREAYEKRNLFRLNKRENKKYFLNNNLFNAKLARAKGEYLKSISLIFKAIYKITSFKDCYRIFKVMVRIHIRPNKGI
ncbi:TPA: glycosyltransferase family 2 protein [Morganella morganii]